MTNLPEAPSVPLALTSVVASGLPVDLGHANSAPFYDVPAVFNRRPDTVEMDALRGSYGHQRLLQSGYSDVTMDVRDRRLIIGHTNLEQLERGLATIIATIIDQVSRDALAERERLLQIARTDHNERAERAHDVSQAAERIRFIPMSADAPTATPGTASKPQYSLSRPTG